MGKGSIKSNSGQAVLENILLMVVMAGAFVLFTRTLKSSNFLNAMTSGPWSSLQMMAECGHWQTNKGCTHPNLADRHLTTDPRKL